MSLSVLSLNVRGIRDLLKRKAFFLFFKKFKCDFYLIQETHASLSDYNFWKSQWGDDLWMSYGSNRAAGVAILKGTFKGKIIKTNIHDSGRWMILVIEKNTEIFVLGNIYASNFSTQNQSLFLNFEDQIEKTVELAMQN